MAKHRAPRQALGVITRQDGVRVEVKNPTIWKAIGEQQQALELQRQVIEQLQAAVAKTEADRDRMKRAFDWLCEQWWVRLGTWLWLIPTWRDMVPKAKQGAAAKVTLTESSSLGGPPIDWDGVTPSATGPATT